MTKTELIDAVATTADLSKAGAGRAVDAMIKAINEALARGEDVTLIGFGTFSVRERAARTGRDPRTGEAIEIPPGKHPAFKAGAKLKEAVR